MNESFRATYSDFSKTLLIIYLFFTCTQYRKTTMEDVTPPPTTTKNLSLKRKVKDLPVALTKLRDKDRQKFQLVLEVDNNKKALHIGKSF
jgi:hypothetical protein